MPGQPTREPRPRSCRPLDAHVEGECAAQGQPGLNGPAIAPFLDRCARSRSCRSVPASSDRHTVAPSTTSAWPDKVLGHRVDDQVLRPAAGGAAAWGRKGVVAHDEDVAGLRRRDKRLGLQRRDLHERVRRGLQPDRARPVEGLTTARCRPARPSVRRRRVGQVAQQAAVTL